MTGNGKYTTYKHGEIWDGLSLFCQHYYILFPSECTFMLGTFIMVAQYYLLISHVGKNTYMVVSENSVPLNPMVNDHNPY